MGGVKRVLNITTITITEYTLSDITPSANPIVAKIKPTSPRGIIPTPTISLSTFPAAKPAAILVMKATTVIARATKRIFGSAKVSSLTFIPVRTKKIGTRK